MIQVGSYLKVADKSGVTLVMCIKVLNNSKNRLAYIGDIVLVSIKRINPRKFKLVKFSKRKKYVKGTIHRALIIRACYFYQRSRNVLIRFNENSIVFCIKKKYHYPNWYMVQ